jgi:hypothetical protein
VDEHSHREAEGLACAATEIISKASTPFRKAAGGLQGGKMALLYGRPPSRQSRCYMCRGLTALRVSSRIMRWSSSGQLGSATEPRKIADVVDAGGTDQTS